SSPPMAPYPDVTSSPLLNHPSLLFFLLTLPPPPRSTLFPYTTLFRSPDVVPPLTPVPTNVVAGHASVTLGWASNREVDMAEYRIDRKSTRLNSSHEWISYAVFCLKKKNKER